MARTRKDAAHKVAGENLDHMMLPGQEKEKAEQLARHFLDGDPAPDGVTQHIRDRAEYAVREGIDHAYGDTMPDDIKNRLDEQS